MARVLFSNPINQYCIKISVLFILFFAVLRFLFRLGQRWLNRASFADLSCLTWTGETPLGAGCGQVLLIGLECPNDRRGPLFLSDPRSSNETSSFTNNITATGAWKTCHVGRLNNNTENIIKQSWKNHFCQFFFCLAMLAPPWTRQNSTGVEPTQRHLRGGAPLCAEDRASRCCRTARNQAMASIWDRHRTRPTDDGIKLGQMAYH